MKTLNELFQLFAKATEQKDKVFINYSGHVNKIYITYYLFGWSREESNIKYECEVVLNEAGIQEAYWFLYNKIN